MRVGLLFFLGSLLAVSSIGCAVENTDDATASDEEALSTADLQALSNIQKEVRAEGEVELHYSPVPAAYRGAPIKFEGVSVALEGTGEEEVEVSVAGRFPSYARVLVVDRDYHIVAQAKTSTEAGLRVQTDGPALGVAKMRVVVPSGGRILIRDRRWDREMDFRVGVRR